MVVLSKLIEMRRTIIAGLLWLAVFVGFYVAIGACLFPPWWKRFLFGGGIADASYWRHGIRALAEPPPLSTPGILVLFVLLVFLLIWGISSARRRFAEGDSYLSPAPPRRLIALVISLCAITLVCLPFVEGEFLLPEEISRELKASVRAVRDAPDPGLWAIRVPPSGTFLYLDRSTVLDQYAALNDSLLLATETQRQVSESKGSATATVPKLVAIGREEKTGSEKSTTLTAPPLTPILAAVRLIERFRRDNGTVALYGDPKEDSELRSVREALKSRGVVLSSAQERQLTRGNVAIWEDAALKSRDRQPMFFHGKLFITRVKDSPVVSATAASPVLVKISGRLSADNLAVHMRYCAEPGNTACTVERATLLGVVEASAASQGDVREMTILALAIW